MKALILVDIQNDFLPGGALAVRAGDEVISVANSLADRFELVLATQDWHPRGHGSFASSHDGAKVGDVIILDGVEQILWPDHCVQGTFGARLAGALNVGAIDRIFQKGTEATIDSYSGLFDNGHRKATGLGDYLAERGADEVYVLGLATDYCVKFTVLDALSLGLKVHVVRDGCRAVNLQPGDADRAIEEMRAAGARITTGDKADPDREALNPPADRRPGPS